MGFVRRASPQPLAKNRAGNPDAIGKNQTPQPGTPAHDKNTVHPRLDQDIPRRKTRRPRAPRQPNPRPARNRRQASDRPLYKESRSRPLPTPRLRERLHGARRESSVRFAQPARRSGVWNRRARIEGRDWVKARIWRLLTDLPFDGDLDLPRLERAVRDGDATLRRMRVDLSEKWRAPLCRLRRGDVPWTNSAAERAIWRSEIRYRTKGLQERRPDAEQVWGDAEGLERSGLTGICQSW